MDFHNFHPIYVFKVKEFTADILTELPCLSDLENPSQLPVWKVLMILSYELFKFSDYSCFRGQGIHCWYFYTKLLCLSYLENLGQLPVQGYLRGTDNFFWWIFTISSLLFYVFEVKESIVDILTELRYLNDLDNPSQLPVWEVLMILFYKLLKFSHYLCFRGRGIHC